LVAPTELSFTFSGGTPRAINAARTASTRAVASADLRFQRVALDLRCARGPGDQTRHSIACARRIG
jgi:hypothetical protein